MEPASNRSRVVIHVVHRRCDDKQAAPIRASGHRLVDRADGVHDSSYANVMVKCLQNKPMKLRYLKLRTLDDNTIKH